jgi:hypothetical protein
MNCAASQIVAAWAIAVPVEANFIAQPNQE